MGSPEYAEIILKKLNEQFNVVGVFTQPDKQGGRGKVIQSPPVKLYAESVGIPILQPNKLSQDEVWNSLSNWHCDLIIVAAYGKILGKKILEFPKYGCINVHASCLPKWRGASPIQSAILHGDPTTGVTIMMMDAGIDTGEIIEQMEMPISVSDTTATLTTKLANVGADILLDTLPNYINGKIIPRKQPSKFATYTSLIKKNDGVMDFNKSAEELERQVRAYDPWPVSFFKWNKKNIKLYKTKVLSSNVLSLGERGILNKYPCIGTGTLDLQLVELQVPGKQKIDGKAFLNGARNWLD